MLELHPCQRLCRRLVRGKGRDLCDLDVGWPCRGVPARERPSAGERGRGDQMALQEEIGAGVGSC